MKDSNKLNWHRKLSILRIRLHTHNTNIITPLKRQTTIPDNLLPYDTNPNVGV